MRLPLFSALFCCALAVSAAAQSQLDVTAKPWSAITGSKRSAFLQVTKLQQGLGANPANLVIREQPLSWSAGSRLYRVSGGWEPDTLELYYLAEPGGRLHPLDGTFKPIRTLNTAVAPTLNNDTVGDYLWFQTFFARGREGPFLIVETVQDHFLPDLENDGIEILPRYGVLEKIPRALSCATGPAPVAFTCTGTVYYSNAMFDATFELSAQGDVTIPKSRPVAVKLHHFVEAPINPITTKSYRPLP